MKVDDFHISDLYDYAYQNNHLTSVMIELLTKCNLKCQHCYIPSHTNSGLSTEKIIILLKNLRNLGALNVSFTGGEIFLRDDIMEIIMVARSLHMRVFLLTNATLLNEEIIKQLSDLHIAEVSTTIFSLDEGIHDSITQHKGSLRKSLSNLKLLNQYGINVQVKTPIMEANKDSHIDLKNYCTENNFSYFPSPIIFSRNDGNNSPHKLRVQSSEDMQDLVFDADKDLRERQRPFLYEYDEPCSAIFYSLAIDANGDIFPCNSLYLKLGNILVDDIKEVWNKSDVLIDLKLIKKEHLKKCNNCYLVEYCERCPGLALLEDGDLLGCSEIAKNMALIRFAK